MNVTLKLTKRQSDRVRRLVRRLCCNCMDDNCLLLDNGENRTCIQLISRYGIYCKYFLDAVLPTDKKLYDDIIGSRHND